MIAVTDARGHRLIEGEDGRKTQLNYAPFLRVTQEIDGLGNRTDLNLESLKVQHTLNLVNTYGKEQELTRRSRTETVSGTSNSKTETFAYDDELRLTKAETQGILWNDQETFTLDGVGNRIPWKYDENNRLIQIGEGSCGSANTICYEYDASGNRIKKMAENRQTHYRYDAQNRLVEVAQTTNGNEQLIARYAYDLFN
ncbi:MAG: hypothetical protein LBB76_07270, partial [Azoarcus sp.]|nr:hypothetical protein [Azoarcus sp.]